MKNKKYGFSLIELLLVLGVILGIVISAFVIFPKIKESQMADKESSEIRILVSGIRDLFKNRNDYIGLSEKVLIDSKIVPDHMVKSNKVYLNGKIPMTFSENHSQASGILYNYFFINIVGFSESECKKILPLIKNDPFLIRINSNEVKRETYERGDVDFDISKAISYCNKDSNTMGLFYN